MGLVYAADRQDLIFAAVVTFARQCNSAVNSFVTTHGGCIGSMGRLDH